jgi:outer membrane protein assembly factor BamB
LPAGKALVIATPDVVAVDLATHLPAWTANGTYDGTPAVSGDVVFATGGSLSALDLATGAVLWTFAGDGALEYQPVVSAGYIARKDRRRLT